MAKEFLKNLKDLFIMPEEGSKPAPKSESATSPVAPKPSSPVSPTTSATPSSNTGSTPSVGKVNDKLAKLLLDAIEKNNQEGFDYLEFKNSLQSLKEMNMDDTTRMKSALAMAKSMGASLETIVTSGQHYLQILKGEQGKFSDAMSNQRSQQVGNKQQQLQDLEKSVKAKEEQILHLQKEIEGIKKEHLGLQQQIEEATKNIEATRLDFETTYNIVAGQIQQDLTKIQELLK